MNFELHTPDSTGTDILMLWLVVWVVTLAMVLSHRRLDSIERLTWVVVVIFVPVFGIFLYAFLAPSQWSPKKIDAHNPLSGTPWENDPGHTAKSVERQT